jgi:hypothetical protein
MGVVSVGAAVWAASDGARHSSVACVIAAAALEAMVMVGAAASRMWRFAPRRRRVDAIALGGVGCLGALLVIPAVNRQGAAIVIAALVGALAVLRVAWPLAR